MFIPLITSMARDENSPKFPIGVAMRYKILEFLSKDLILFIFVWSWSKPCLFLEFF